MTEVPNTKKSVHWLLRKSMDWFLNDRDYECGICSKLTIKTPERRHFCRYDVFIVNFVNIFHTFF